MPFRVDHNAWLSNLSEVEKGIKHEHRVHPTLEHAYKTAEVVHHNKPEAADKIAGAKTGLEAMKIANAALRGVPISKEWKTERVRVMRDLLELKAEASPRFAEKLCESGDVILVEATAHSFWGSGHGGVKPTTDKWPSYWEGVNMLGRLLMDLRTKLQSKLAKENEEKKIEGDIDEKLIEIRDQMLAEENGDIRARADAVTTSTPSDADSRGIKRSKGLTPSSVEKSAKKPVLDLTNAE